MGNGKNLNLRAAAIYDDAQREKALARIGFEMQLKSVAVREQAIWSADS